MRGQRRDSQRSRVYKSEYQCGFYEFMQTIKSDELQQWTEQNILGRAWFRKRYGNKYPRVEVGRSKGQAFGSHTIKLGVVMRNPWVICHEVAHTLTVGDMHGSEFARTFIFLIERVVGKDEGAELERHMRENRVKIKPKSWIPKPTHKPVPYDYTKVVRKPEKIKVQATTFKDVERAARKLDAKAEITRGRNEWDLTVTAPEGYEWVTDEYSERAEISPDRARIVTYFWIRGHLTATEVFDEAIYIIKQGITNKELSWAESEKPDVEVTATAAETTPKKKEGQMSNAKVTVRGITATDDNGWSWETHIEHANQEVEVRQYKTGADRKRLYRMVEERWAEVFGDEFVVKGRNSVYGKAKRLAEKEVSRESN